MQHPESPATGRSGSSARILVIDDEEDVRALLQDALEEAGYEVVLAANGALGLAAQRLCPADLVVTDLFMPEKEGIETIRDLRNEFPSVEIVAMSGGGRVLNNDTYLFAANSIGARLVLRKPFGRGVLLEAVRSALAPKEG